MLLAIALSLVVHRFAFPDYRNQLTDLLLAIAPGALLIAAVGLLDDLRGCRPAEKLVVQGVALLLFQTSAFALGVTGVMTAQTSGIVLAAVVLNTWMLGLTNSMNLIDGMDGLASGLAATSALGIAGLALAAGDPAVSACAAMIAGASLGFRRSNRAPARIYLGDGGSLLLGFGLAATGAAVWLREPGIGAGVSLVLMTWVPLLDTGTTILRRLASGIALFQPDRDHLHHRLLARGATTGGVSFHLIGLNALGVATGLAVHFGAPALLMTFVMVIGSLGVFRAAIPLKVTKPVQRDTGADHRDHPPTGAQERAA